MTAANIKIKPLENTGRDGPLTVVFIKSLAGAWGLRPEGQHKWAIIESDGEMVELYDTAKEARAAMARINERGGVR